MRLVHRLRTELKVNTSCGASNVSFGLPNREGINSAFLPMAIASGMTSAITNPLQEDLLKSIMAADVLMGHDPQCMRWIRKFRDPMVAGSEAEAARGRRDSRRRRA
jgi:5-methyltetrahydrofolate--homocysteine methyltransferase